MFEDSSVPERAWSLLEEKAADEAELLSSARVELALFVEKFESRDHGDHQRDDRSGCHDPQRGVGGQPGQCRRPRTRTLASRASLGVRRGTI